MIFFGNYIKEISYTSFFFQYLMIQTFSKKWDEIWAKRRLASTENTPSNAFASRQVIMHNNTDLNSIDNIIEYTDLTYVTSLSDVSVNDVDDTFAHMSVREHSRSTSPADIRHALIVKQKSA
jgi:hypothetical protein